MVPSTRQIEQKVAAVLQRDAGARVVGIHSVRSGTWPEQVRVGARAFQIAWCESPLAVREALANRPSEGQAGSRPPPSPSHFQGEGSGGGDDADGLQFHRERQAGLILLTSADDQALGADVLARLARGRVFRLQSWELVRDLFQARDIDPRLGKLAWVADFLVERAPAGGYPPVPGGFLSADTAWQSVLDSALGIVGPRPDAVALIEWSLHEDASPRFHALPDLIRTDVAEWLAEGAGPAGRPIVASVAAGSAADVLPLGLVCELLFREGGQGDPALSAAAARLERFTDGHRVAQVAGRRWAEAALAALSRVSEPTVARRLLARADALLMELGLAAQAEASDVLQAGFEARLGRYAEALRGAVGAMEARGRRAPSPLAPLPAGEESTASSAALVQAEAAAERVLAHQQARQHPSRCQRLTMSLRLLRWLASPDPSMSAFGVAARAYVGEGAYVDWARMTLLGGDDLALLSTNYAELAVAVRARRERFNRRFTELLVSWNGAGAAGGPGLVPVEEVLGSLLAPLARDDPVLLLVADGMSLPVFRALAPSLTALGWTEMAPADGPRPLAAIAALPTVTESSRASLLCGRLTLGTAPQEKSGFGAHPALLAVSRPTARPVLFHKAELGDGSGLSDPVRDAVRARDQKVVGVVYNAVDDHLSGSDQLHLSWSVDDRRLLRPLLHEARLAGRAIVITADHGHVLDEGTTQRSHEEGDRWRRSAGPVAADEVELFGGRVIAPGGLDRLVLPWSEGVRYAGKKNGYHGGTTPQEVLVPLIALAPTAQPVSGWVPIPPDFPEWWEAGPPTRREPQAALPAVPAGKRRKAPTPQADLFATVPAQPAADAWVDRLLASPVYAEQKRLAARIAPGDDELRRFLLALDGRGGKLSKTALAQRLGMPLVRVGGLLSAVRRVLNVDRAGVVTVDEAAAVVELSRGLLDAQFQLKGP